MNIFSILILALTLPSFATAVLSSVSFDGVHLQLQSNSPPEEDYEKFLLKVLAQTVKYLDKAFAKDFAGSEFAFSHIGLNVESYEIDSGKERNFASFSFSGSAFFNSKTAPPEDDVLGILAHSFLGGNSQVYTRTLMEADNPFLKRLSYAIVKVNGFEFPPSVTSNAEESQSSDSMDKEKIAVIAGISAASVLVLLLCYCFCCVSTDDNNGMDEHPAPQKKRTIDTSDTSNDIEESEDVEAVISPAPSSPQSIASQDSSIFTYNPRSRMSFDASTLSTNTTDTNTMDLQSWQRRDTINSSRFAPFGHDISAIEMLNENKRDLSLIEEGDESATPVKRSTNSKGDHLSKDLLSKQERRERSERTKSRNTSYLSEASSDVIADLRNLSQQINHYRHR